MQTSQHWQHWPKIYQTLSRCRLVIVASSKLQAIPDQLLFPANTKHLYNICTTSAQHLRRWTKIVEIFCVYWVERSPANTRCWSSAGLMLGQRRRWWASIGLALGQRRVCWKCWQAKRNKFRLIHRLYCPQEPFNIINYKSHWHYID